MTRISLGSLIGCLLFTYLSVGQADMMMGPAIIGTTHSGAQVQVFADDGDGIFDVELDTLVKTVSADDDGAFSVSNLDMAFQYFLSSGETTSELTAIGEIQGIIDTFDITQSVIANPVTGARVSSVSGPGILGESRDLFVEVLEGTVEAKLRANPFSQNSNLQIDLSAGIVGKIGVTWDGTPGSSGMMEPDAGLDIDFTEGGKYTGITLGLAVDRAGIGQMLKLAMHSPTGMSVAEVEFPYNPPVEPTGKYVQFTDFIGDADPTQVTAFQLMIEETLPSLDAQVNVVGLSGPAQVTLLPEPTGATWATPVVLLLLTLARRRR